MSYRKFASDFLFDGYRVLTGRHVLITSETGMIVDLLPAEEVSGEVQYFRGVLVPGFINCHCHLELSHMRNQISQKSGMTKFLLEVMTKRASSDNEINQAMTEAEAELTANGVVAVGDICNTTHSLQIKLSSGLRYYNFIEATGFIPFTAQARFDQSREVYNRFINSGLVNCSIVPHAPYSVSPSLFQKIAAFSDGNVLSMHNQESIDEQEFFLSGKGSFRELYKKLNLDISFYTPPAKSSLLSALPFIGTKSPFIFVHNVFTDENDIKHTNDMKVWWCLCPRSNQYITGDLPDLELFRKHSPKVVIGTDSLASNEQLDILSELITIQSAHKNIQTQELLRWATSNGAAALGFSDHLGSFEKGKTPGVINIQINGGGKLEGKAVRIV